MANPYGCSADQLINTLERADYIAHTTHADRGGWMLPLLQLLTAGAVALGRRLERGNR